MFYPTPNNFVRPISVVDRVVPQIEPLFAADRIANVVTSRPEHFDDRQCRVVSLQPDEHGIDQVWDIKELASANN